MFCMDSVAAFWLTERSDSVKLMDRRPRKGWGKCFGVSNESHRKI